MFIIGVGSTWLPWKMSIQNARFQDFDHLDIVIVHQISNFMTFLHKNMIKINVLSELFIVYCCIFYRNNIKLYLIG